MEKDRPGPVTQLLHAAGAGDPTAAADLLPLVYEELRKLARARLAQTPPGNTLQPTALVHEAYLRLVGGAETTWNSRGHFFAAAAQAMRQILVDSARRKRSKKRGGERQRIELDDIDFAPELDHRVDLLEVDRALTELQQVDERKARIVLLRYFAGLSEEDTASALDVSVRTVQREWRFARAVLFSALVNEEQANRESGNGPSADPAS